MKLASFRIADRNSYGAVMEDGVAEASRFVRYSSRRSCGGMDF